MTSLSIYLMLFALLALLESERALKRHLHAASEKLVSSMEITEASKVRDTGRVLSTSASVQEQRKGGGRQTFLSRIALRFLHFVCLV
jgi:hypothetical protein